MRPQESQNGPGRQDEKKSWSPPTLLRSFKVVQKRGNMECSIDLPIICCTRDHPTVRMVRVFESGAKVDL